MERALSGIQPSGKLTLGNYIGAIKQFKQMQDEYEMYIFVANMHSITVDQPKKDRVTNTKNLVAFYLAAGLDTTKTTIFLQSEVQAHTQLGWIMQCHTYMGELNRMTQFKEKSQKNESNINVGLFSYPSLMAADILLYDPVYVPVGDDQSQHLEIARTLANRFNNKYSETFRVPELLVRKEGARIMSLANPSKKMSKSDDAGDKGCIYLLDSEKEIIKKIKGATTDSIGIVQYDVENQPGISNLLTIYAALEDISIDETQNIFKDYSYAQFKEAIASCVAKHVGDLQANYNEIINNDLVEKALEEGAQKANIIANRKVNKVMKKLGLLLK